MRPRDKAKREWFIKEKLKEIPWTEDRQVVAVKAVYRDLLEGFPSLDEAKEYLAALDDNQAFYTTRGYEVPVSLLKNVIKHVERNPSYSPWGPVPMVREGDVRTFYGIQWWLADESDIRTADGIDTLEQALSMARELNDAGKGYHDFTIYAYHAKLVNEPFPHQGVMWPYRHWQKLDDGFEQYWDISGKEMAG
jgi:hypothetical protein